MIFFKIFEVKKIGESFPKKKNINQITPEKTHFVV